MTILPQNAMRKILVWKIRLGLQSEIIISAYHVMFSNFLYDKNNRLKLFFCTFMRALDPSKNKGSDFSRYKCKKK